MRTTASGGVSWIYCFRHERYLVCSGDTETWLAFRKTTTFGLKAYNVAQNTGCRVLTCSGRRSISCLNNPAQKYKLSLVFTTIAPKQKSDEWKVEFVSDSNIKRSFSELSQSNITPLCLCVCVATCALEVSNGSAGDAAIFSILIPSLAGSPAEGGTLYMAGAGA